MNGRSGPESGSERLGKRTPDAAVPPAQGDSVIGNLLHAVLWTPIHKKNLPEEKLMAHEHAIFDRIRQQSRFVSTQARHVRILTDRISGFVEPLCRTPLSTPEADTSAHIIGTVDETIAFFVTLAAINFGSGYFPHLVKRPGRSGYYTIATALTERFRSMGPLRADQLVSITPHECAALFHQDMENPVIEELMTAFARAWNDLGKHVIAEHQGDFSSLIAAADHRAARLVMDLARQPFFRDVSSYHGEKVPFYKRSQLLASDLSLTLHDHPLGRFDDLNSLTIFADNLVPHVLRLEGILEYSVPLLREIEAEHLIPAGSDEEIEIRACSIHAVELMIEAAAAAGVRWTARDVDQVLWHQGQHPRFKKQSKRHRTRTVFY